MVMGGMLSGKEDVDVIIALIDRVERDQQQISISEFAPGFIGSTMCVLSKMGRIGYKEAP